MKKRFYKILNCKKCNIEIKIRTDYLKKSSGFCKSCVHQKRPFESIYNNLFNDHRKPKINLKYNEFLEFTKIDKCEYCFDKINWIEYSTKNNEYFSRAYFLDQKDYNKGYSKENCIVCCTKCNRAKGNRYSYEEWYGMTKYFRDQK